MRHPNYYNQWDVFISYASEDLDTVARPLAEALELTGLRVWFDRTALKIGDSLFAKINEGLSQCTYGIVVLSKKFLAKNWPQRELGALMTRDTRDRSLVLPVWHEITEEHLREQYPILADRVAVSTNQGINHAVSELVRAMNLPFAGTGLTGLWVGPSGRLRVTNQGGGVRGDYDWAGYEWSGHLEGVCNEDILLLEWHWDLSDENGIGYLELETSDQQITLPEANVMPYGEPRRWLHHLRRLSGGWATSTKLIRDKNGMSRVSSPLPIGIWTSEINELRELCSIPWWFTSVTRH